MKERKYHSFLQEGQEGGRRELQASYLDPWKGDGAADSGNYFQAH